MIAAEIIEIESRMMPHCNPNCCFINVQQAVDMFGGKPVFGWEVFDQKYIRTLGHHAIWQMADGELRNITPKIVGMVDDQIVSVLSITKFLPDEKAVWESPEDTLGNRYLPLGGGENVAKACGMLAQADRAVYKGDFEGQRYYVAKANKLLAKFGMEFGAFRPELVKKQVVYKMGGLPQ